MPTMGGCLYECLKKAHLDPYYSSFVRHGIIKCEGLATLSMHEYSRFGVLSMEDRVRLFKLVQIVKSVLADGLHCQHEYPALRSSSNKLSHITNNTHGVAKLSDMRGQRNGTSVTTRCDQPPAVAKTKVSQPRVDNKVQYLPGSDTPVFKCRKVLTFSDSEEEEEVDTRKDKRESNISKPLVVAEIKPKATGQGNTRVVIEREVRSLNVVKDSAQNQQVQSVTSKRRPPEKFYVDLKTDFPVPKTPETQIEKEFDISEIIDMDDKNDSGNNSASTQNKTSSSGRRTNASSERSRCRNISFELDRSDISNCSMNSEDRRRPSSESGLYSRSISSRSRSASPPKRCFSQNSDDLANDENKNDPPEIPVEFQRSSETIPNDEEHAAPGLESSMSQKSPPRPIGAFFVDGIAHRDHAYFPQIQPPKKFATRVETVVHNSEYNYGIPGLVSSPKTSEAKSGVVNFTSSERKVTSRKPSGVARNRDERIRVCVRKRPLLKKESKRQETDVVTAQNPDVVVVEESKVTIDLSKYVQKHVFLFDEVFDSVCSNQDVYEGTAKPLVQHVLQGGCGTCFAFGQTGAGKTFTLLGDKVTPGLYQLAAKDIFHSMSTRQWGSEVHLWLSYYEIYCGQLYDLLNKRKRLTVRENGKQKVCIAGLMETEVKSFNNLTHAVEYGNNVRSIGNTGVNPKSSRSHAVLTLEIRTQQDYLLGKMSFIDLAGSERASDVTEFNKQTRLEGAEINQSLLALKECIRSLDQQEQHTPYRQSKLTHILRDSFLGNSKTCMIANISPIQSACENTLNTLRYADRVKELRRGQENSTHNPIVQASEKKSKALNLVEAGPSLFHPSTIQGSSTPKKNSFAQHPDKSFDVNKALHDAYESPIRGHKLHKLSNKRRTESTMGVQLSPHRGDTAGPSSRDSSSGRNRSNSANRSPESSVKIHHPEETDKAVSRENMKSVRTLLFDENSGGKQNLNHYTVSNTTVNIQPSTERSEGNGNLAGNSKGRWSYGPHKDSQFSTSSKSQANVSDKHNERKVRKEDILQEHRQILSHLDDIMLRSRAAMSKSTVIDKEIEDIEGSRPLNSKQMSGPENAYNASPQRPFNSQNETDFQSSTNDSPLRKSSKETRNSNQYPSIMEYQGSQERSQPTNLLQHSPLADQLQLAQIRIKKQQQLLEIQQQQIQAMSQDTEMDSGNKTHSSTDQHFVPSRLPVENENLESTMLDMRIVDNGVEANWSSVSVDKAPKTHSDERKPKLSGTNISNLMPRETGVVSEHSSVQVKNELDKSLPPPEDFLKSLAEMKLNKQLCSGAGTESKTKSNVKLNPQQLAQLGEHFKHLGIDTRPFQDLLGSPSNTRGGSKHTAFQPVQPKSDVRKQLIYSDNSVKLNEQSRASADGEETKNLVRPPIVSSSDIQPTAVIAPIPTERDSRQVGGQNVPSSQIALPSFSQTGATLKGAAICDNSSGLSSANFTPIETHPVTAPASSIVKTIETSNPLDEGPGESPNNIIPVVKDDMESLKLNLAALSDVEQHGDDKRPKSGREYVRYKQLVERGGRLDEVNTARGRIERSAHPKEPSKERARQQLITAHEDQLAEITNLCKHEMKLLMSVKMGDQTFDEYVRVLRDVLSNKAQCVATLSSQIRQLENMSPTGSPKP